MKIIERGWPGHFICVDKCFFRRNTLIDKGRKKIVVSTVGGMTKKDGGFETIGAFGRYYETMAFEAKKVDGYWEANVSKEVEFNNQWSICADSVEQLPDGVDNVANSMHDTIVKELSEES